MTIRRLTAKTGVSVLKECMISSTGSDRWEPGDDPIPSWGGCVGFTLSTDKPSVQIKCPELKDLTVRSEWGSVWARWA